MCLELFFLALLCHDAVPLNSIRLQGYMTAALQTYARTTKIAIDTLEFKTAVLKMTPEEVVHGPKQVYLF